MPPNRHRMVNTGPVDLTDADISFPLARLFDPQNLDHVPEKERMDVFEHRDLAHIKHYKAAVKIFGGPLSRKRVMIAPPMETTTKHRLGIYMDRKSPPPAPILNSELKPQIPPEKPLPEEVVIAKQAQDREDKYKQWFKERQKFRNNLENMGLNMEWLANKPNKTVQEKRVLNRLKEEAIGKKLEEEKNIDESPEPVVRSQSAESDSSTPPYLKVPAPLGVIILEKHLKEKKLRLIDLFADVDKNKDWSISREEFVKSCEEKNIPISKGLLEDMLIALDMNLNEELDYKELARGLELTKRQRIEDRRKDLSSRESSFNSKGTGSRNDSRSEKSKDDRGTGSSGRQDRSRRSTPQKGIMSPGLGKTTTTAKQQDTSLHSTTSSKSGKFADHSSQKSVIINDQVSVLSESSPAKSGKINTKTGTAEKQAGNQTISKERPGTPSHLEPPDKDVREERLILKSEEAMVDLRKHDREALKGYRAGLEVPPGTIKTGSKSIDDHCMRSTLIGDVGEMIDQFRQKRLHEYYDIVRLCKENEVVLSQKLLEKAASMCVRLADKIGLFRKKSVSDTGFDTNSVPGSRGSQNIGRDPISTKSRIPPGSFYYLLLYPPDLPHSDLKKLRHPDSAPLVSSHFADPPKRPRTPIEVKHKDKVRRSKSGKLLIDSRHKYPAMKSVAAEGYKHNLSTGRAVIRRQVDCWMTFEEYEKLTKHLAVRYQNLHGSAHHNVFWPGHLLDKIRLCMPPYDRQGVRDKEAAIFRRVHRTKAVNYGYEPTDVWPTNDSMYTQIGIHDHFRNKTII